MITFSCAVTKEQWAAASRKALDGIDKAVADAAQNIEIDAKLPGHCPVDTGNLASSILAKCEGPYWWSVGPRGPEYGIYVEYGTSRMAAHPYMRPAAQRQQKPFFEAVAKALK